jgi:high-affinity Fe2+/Pb2+ permease
MLTVAVFMLDHSVNLIYKEHCFCLNRIKLHHEHETGEIKLLIEINIILEWIRSHSTMIWVLSTLSLVTFVGTLIMIPFFVARIPADYFVRKQNNPGHHYITRSNLRCFYLVFKNLVGIVFILAGMAMLFLPGQGIVTIFIGIMLMNFPGKRILTLRIVRKEKVFRAINWMRAKVQQPPLQLPVTK